MSWVEGLLGAVMGGAQEYGTILKEEETAKRKEEEEKRKEERALSLFERQEAAKEAREKRQEEARQAAAKKEREAIAQTSPSKAPETGIVGNAIDEYQGEIANTGYTGQTRQATPEEALRWSIGKAREEGREDLAKQREDALYKMLEEGRRSAKETREQMEFGRGPKPEKPTTQMQNVEAIAKEIYGGDDPKRIAEARKQAMDRVFPPREPRGGPKPMTQPQIDAAEARISKIVDKFSVTKKIGDKTAQPDPEKRVIVNSLLLQLKDEEIGKDPERDPNALLKVDLNKIESELASRFSRIESRSKEIAGQKFDEFRGSKTTPGNPNAITDPALKEFAKNKDFSKEAFVNAAAPKFLQEAAAGGKSESNTKTVTFQGKQYTVRKAPDGNWYREEGGKYYRWSE